MNAPVPSDICPVKPVRMFNPIEARVNTKNGIIIAPRKNSFPKIGMAINPIAKYAQMKSLSWKIGNLAESASYVALY